MAARCLIYHNPRCSKSRQALALLQAQGIPFEVRRYLDEPLSVNSLKALAKQLQCRAGDMMRRKDILYKELGLDRETTTDQQRISALAERPQLLERPIVVIGQKAVIARPPERLLDLL